VLYDWHPRFLYEKLIDDPDELSRVIDIVLSDQWHWQLDAGRTFAEIEPQLVEQFPEDADYIRAWGARFQESIGPQIEGMAAIVDALEAVDVPIFGITNFPGEFWIPFRAREAALFDRFADIVVSGIEGIAKPDPAIFQLAQERFGRTAETMIFIDDLSQNVAAAEAAGFVGHQFRDAPALHAALSALGLIAG
jgi:2-haloacid dehalogenase